MNAREHGQIKKAIELLERADVDQALVILCSLTSIIKRVTVLRPRRMAMPKREEIVKAQKFLLAHLDIKLKEAHSVCWFCRNACRPIRAHIVASSHGGGEKPDNFFLLCEYCEPMQPDGIPYQDQIAWIKRGIQASTILQAYYSLAGEDVIWLIRLAVEVYGEREAQRAILHAMDDGASAAASSRNLIPNQAYFLMELRKRMRATKSTLDQLKGAWPMGKGN